MMIKKSIIVKLSIFAELNGFEESVTCSNDDSNEVDIQELVDSINLTFVDSLEHLGFQPISRIPRHVSYRNGGYALYTTFQLVEDCIKFKLIFDTRVADHSSKNLPAKNEIRKEGLAGLYPEIKEGIAECSVIDTYIEQHNGDLSIFIGTSAYPSRPCKSVERANTVLTGKVKAIIRDEIKKYTDAALSEYPDDTVDFIKEYLDDCADLSVFEFDGDDWISTSNESDLKELRLEYLEVGSDEGIIESIDEFDRLCEIVNLIYKYS